MSRARVVILGLVLCLGACDVAFGLERTPEVLPTCGATAPVIVDDFSSSDTCRPWGDPFENSGTTVLQERGVLQIIAHADGAAGCTSIAKVAFTAHVFTARVAEVISTDGAYTSLNANDFESITEANGELLYENGAASMMYARKPYDADEMRWWRLESRAGTVTASYSADAVTWTELGHRTAPVPAAEKVGLVAGLFGSPDGVQGSSSFDYVLLCD